MWQGKHGYLDERFSEDTMQSEKSNIEINTSQTSS